MKCLNIALIIGAISVVVVAVVVDQMQLAWSKDDKITVKLWMVTMIKFYLLLDKFMADMSFENSFDESDLLSNSSIENPGNKIELSVTVKVQF